jgi:hypothetical protein
MNQLTKQTTQQTKHPTPTPPTPGRVGVPELMFQKKNTWLYLV